MSFKQEYQQKLCTAQEAVQVVRSGDWIDFGWCASAPETLDAALAERYEELYDVKARGAVLTWRPKMLSVPNTAEHFTWHSWHFSGLERKLMNEGIAWYIPLRYSELPRYYRENVEPIRAAMLQVAPKDDEGSFSFGLNSSHLQPVCEKAQVVIVEVNE